MRLTAILLSLTSVMGMTAAVTPYRVNLDSGVMPADVSVANENSLLPNASGYKRGWTDQGWTVDRYGNRGYVAVSPTFTVVIDEDGHTGPVSPSRNVMRLPSLSISAGDFLSWHAVSSHPDFPEAYRVEATVDGVSTVLFETEAENAVWTPRMVDLSALAGKDAVISFVCVSENRYMLAIDDIEVGQPQGLSLVADDRTEIYHGPEATAPVTVYVLNSGASISGGKVVLSVDSESLGEIQVSELWHPGETREFEFELPLELNRRTEYEVSYLPADGGESVRLSSKTLYSSNFKKRLVVDKGTGMWCVNCPEGILDIENIERQFGESLIPLDTHTTSGSESSDLLANPDYFSALGFRSVPWMMLNRIKNSSASNTQQFPNFYFKPVKLDLHVSGIEKEGDGAARVSVSVSASENMDNSTDRYRIGYVLTSDIYRPDDYRYFQRNGSTKVTSDRFYYLPSRIPAPLCVFHNVTLTSRTAFDGIKGSLPATVSENATVEYKLSFDKPEMVDNIDDVRVVAYVLDTETGEILAADALKVADGDISGIRDVAADNATCSISVTADGEIVLDFAKPAAYRLEIFSVDGRKCVSTYGEESARAVHRFNQAKGMYIVRVTADGKQVCRKAVL